jgi:spermidine synthase
MFRDINPAFYPYSLLVFGCLLVMLAPAVIVSGAMLPLLFHTLRHEVGDLGSQAGRLYSANTLGSLLGALIGGYLLLIWLDLHHVYRIAVAALALAATIVTLHQFPRIRFVGAATLLIAVLATVSSFHAWRPEYLAAGAFRVRQPTSWSFMGPSGLVERNWTFSFYDDDPNTSVAINDSGTGDDLTRSIIVNGKSDGNTAGDYTTTALLALVPALFAESAEQAFVIGFGTGTTAGILANLEDTKSVTIAEISSGVIKGSPLFDFFNKNVSTNPKIHIVHSDAYRALLKGGGQYDVIVSEPSNPWVAGIEQLYSQEFLAAARDHLKPTGVYCQWFHYYEMNPEAVALVLKTYASVFDHVAVWSTNYADGMLLGFQDPERALDLDRFDQRIARPDFAAVLERLGIRDGATLLAHEVLPIGVANAATLPGAVHSLYHPLLSYAAGRAFFVGQRADLPFTGYGEPARVGADHSLLGRYLARAEPARRASLYGEVATYVCEHQLPGCSALVAKWGSVDGESAEFRQLANQLRTQRGPFYIRRLRGLIEGMPRNADGRLRPAVAASMTQLYMEQYAHSVPFDPDTLLRIWERCGYDEPGIERCHPGLSVAQRFMAGESPPDPQLWLVPEVQEPSTTHHAATPEPPPVGEAKDAKDEPNGHEAGEGEDL